MALFDSIKDQICPEFMAHDTNSNLFTITGNKFKEKGSVGKFLMRSFESFYFVKFWPGQYFTSLTVRKILTRSIFYIFVCL